MTLTLLMHTKNTLDKCWRRRFFQICEWNTITEAELENIHSDIDHKFSSATISWGIITLHHNYSENFIDNTKEFIQYCSWILCKHKGIKIQTSTTQVINVQLGGWSKSQVFTKITKFSYIRSVKCSAQILNGRRFPAKGLGLVIIKTPKTNIIISLWTSQYMPHNTQNTMIKTDLKYYNEFKSVRTEALRWLNISKEKVKKLKVETTVKERYQQLLELITIDVVKVEQQQSPYHNIKNMTMTPIINIYFN